MSNSIEKRIERLSARYDKPVTRKQNKINLLRDKYLKLQENKCICGYRFTGHDKAHVDFSNLKQFKSHGVVCEQCEQILRLCGRDIRVLQKLIKYLKIGGSFELLNEQFDTGTLEPIASPQSEPKPVADWFSIKDELK